MRRLEWSDALQHQLARAIGNDAQAIKQDVESGQLLALSWGGELVTVTETQGDTFVLCCMAGRNFARYMQHIYYWAKCNGCESIRFHSARRGLVRIAKQYEFQAVGADEQGQTIYQCEVQ